MATGTGLVGTTVLHYHIVERLGGGGMGEVYLAEDQRLGRRVALKFLAASVDRDGEARERLIREAQAAALLRSPHIAVTYDLAEYEVAIHWLKDRTLDAFPDGVWTAGARYNLGRTYEALGRIEDARRVYYQSEGNQRHGNLLRAMLLRGA